MFPRIWKEASVVLIWKGKEEREASSYRPICLLNTFGKLFEKLLEANGGLSENQFGFRKGLSTIQAVEKVIAHVKETRARWVVMLALDVRNAFNSASWEIIMKKLEARNISQYLINIVDSYLSDRSIKIGKGKIKTEKGVPQGSVLGPTLWNILYDDVLSLQLGENSKLVAYADDIALIVHANDIEELNHLVAMAADRIGAWMKQNELRLAPEKTEAIILKGHGKKDKISIEVLGAQIQLTKKLKYLGVMIGQGTTFGSHIKYATEKADNSKVALRRITRNIGGPSSRKRMLLYGVIQSIMYAAPVWAEWIVYKKYRNLLISAQRKALLLVAMAYRTVSAAGIQVVTGVPPMDLLVRERDVGYTTDLMATRKGQKRRKGRRHSPNGKHDGIPNQKLGRRRENL